MTDKELRRLNRTDLLEILIEQQETIEQLTRENERLRERMKDKRIALERAGSIAEASLAVNRVFEAAQRAADQYLENVKRLADASNISAAEAPAVSAEDAAQNRRRRRG